jgi:signal transduction histidine kinase
VTSHPPRRFPGSLRDRILVPYLALTVGMVAVTGLACGHWAAERAWEQGLERGRSLAETLRRSRFPLTQPVLEQLRGLGGVEFALLDGRGRVEASTVEASGLASLGRALPADLSFRPDWSGEGVAYRVAAVDRPPGASGSGEAQRLLILLPEPALHAAAWEARRTALVLSVIGAALAALLACVLGRNLARPLGAIASAIHALGAGDRRPSGLPTDRDDEIGELARGVARLAERLEDLERERAQTERLRLVRQVSAGLAHELRNPLTAARMTLQVFMERNRDRDPEPLRVALAELQRVERQVRRFLQLARPEPPRPEPVALGPLLEQVAAGLAASAEHQGVRLSVEPEGSDAPAMALADPEQLAQVAANLARNAIEAAGPGGSVRLAASPGAIAVEDDGPGIPPDDLARLFQPFFTTKPEGVGLGLALCDALVREAGGSIAYSREQGLTRFLVTLPAAPEPAAPGAARVGPPR